MTFTDYGTIDALHTAVEPLKNRNALAKVRTVNFIDNTHTGLNKVFRASLEEAKLVASKLMSENGNIGLRSVLVSVSDNPIDDVQILVDSERKIYNTVSVPTASSLIRHGTEKKTGAFRLIEIKKIEDLDDHNKLSQVKEAYIGHGIPYCNQHLDLTRQGLRPAIVIYDMNRLEKLTKGYEYKIKSEIDRENAIIGLVVTDFPANMSTDQ